MNETTVTTPSELEIRVERIFEAPRAHVFSVWTDPKLIPEWWGDGTVVEVMDVRPGGTYRFRTAFPDLRFDADELVCEGETVACRSTMTGTHQGPLRIGPMAGLPVNGTQIEVPHMHFFHYDADGRLTDLWHVWNTIALARQLGAPAPDLSISAPA